MSNLTNKRVLLGLCGSIAAYKGAELVRRLREVGASVRVAMTPAATGFITPLTLQSLSGHSVRTEMMDPVAEAAMGHIELARWADVVLIAPATQDFIARLAQGRADDLLTALCSVANCPVLIAPAMNHSMWENPATQENVKQLKTRGVQMLGPADGSQACGEFGEGRLLEVAELINAVAQQFTPGSLQGVRVLVTAGPTREAVDPVRFLSNRSSGKMGYALASAAMEAGAEVTLVSGPVCLDAPLRVRVVNVISAQQMYDQVVRAAPGQDVFIAAAAVADFRPVQRQAQKIKKSTTIYNLELEPTPDIVRAVTAASPRPFVVGFAAETEQLLPHARQKLKSKNLDMIAANWVGETLGFEQDENALEVLWGEEDQCSLPASTKSLLARQLIQLIAERYYAKCTAKNS